MERSLERKNMKFVKVKADTSKEEMINLLADNNRVNEKVRFDDKRGKPHMKIKEKNGKIRITCEMMGGVTKDNGFIVGSFFWGKIKENNGTATLSGIILTAPVYHFIFLLLMGFFVVQCIINKGFSIIPIFLLLFDILLFKDEFKKQGYIYRYIYRAAHILNRQK